MIEMKSGELAYLSKRFDRTSDGKLALEDFAQLLEVLTERKYSGSVERIGKGILQYSSFPGNDLINLFELVLFCFLIGNSDMHLKNFSLLRDEQDYIKLSPVYDLLSTILLLPADPDDFAITIYGEKSKLRRYDFDKLASNLNLNDKTLKSIYLKYTGIFNQWEALIEKSFISDGMKEGYKSLIFDRMKQIALWN
jgi:serine/threonine-protein kinase HipA